MCNAGLIPERTADPGRAFHLWSSDGAVILSTNRTDAAGMLAGAREVFGPRLFVCRLSSTTAASTTESQLVGCDPVAQAGAGNGSGDLQVDFQPHIDGYLEFGNYYPDLVFVLGQRQAVAGGEWFLLDGQRLLDGIASDPTRRALSRFLWEVQLEAPRSRGVGPCGAGKPPGRGRPVASRTCAGRLTVRRHPHQRLADGGSPQSGNRQHLAAWAKISERTARVAPRFVLHPGDLLCLDNYRVFHGRVPGAGASRTVHRLWAWTDMSFGLPCPEDLSCGSQAESIAEPSR
jgi:alpha-ketoglutarate-dependent taurine dioxygenase